MLSRFLIALLLGTSTVAVAVERLPIEDFARLEELSDVELSPDGTHVGFIRGPDGYKRLAIADVATMKVRSFTMGGGTILPGERGPANFDWISAERMVVRTVVGGVYQGGWVALDRDGRNRKVLSGEIALTPTGRRVHPADFFPRDLLHVFGDGRTVLVSNPRLDFGRREILYPEVVKVDTVTGVGLTVTKNPGNVLRWIVDGHGTVRVGVGRDGESVWMIQREKGTDEWSPRVTFSKQDEVGPISFAEDNQHLYVRARSERNRWALYRYDLKTHRTLEKVWEHPIYDFGATIREPGTNRLIGVRYNGEKPHTVWLDPKYAEVQAAVDAKLPDTRNGLWNFSEDGRVLLITAFSDRDPGTAYAYDIQTQELRELGRSRPWIKPEQMAPMRPISYTARDGVRIHGYITLPLDTGEEGLPLVAMPHGGPWARDLWGFDPLVQMLANRGYAVLQMNYRGSTGYGRDLEQRGRREIGGKIQTDIEDAVRWAIDKKLADPKRVAIVGASYGGYAALDALARSPDLYRCGVSISGVSDWIGIFESVEDPEHEISRAHWTREIGDPKAQMAHLRAISPVNLVEKITAPVLIVHGRDDQIVPLRQARKMISALKKVGREPESLFLRGQGHTILSEKARIAQYKAIEAFLAKHMGAEAVAH